MSLEEDFKASDEARFLPADFSGFIVSLAHAAMVHLGEMPDPVTGAMNRDIEQARYSIDLIDMFVVKTKGNLTPDEEMLLTRVAGDLKLKYVRQREVQR